MTFFADLTPYRYLPGHDRPDILNVGWLDAAHGFPTGFSPVSFHEALLQACRTRVNQTRGFHQCQFCAVPIGSGVPVNTENTVMVLGSAEVHILASSGITYAAPNLIYHYVTAHLYLPPAPFIRAVLEVSGTITGA